MPQARHETPLPDTERVAVRLNGIGTPFFEDDLRAAVSCFQFILCTFLTC